MRAAAESKRSKTSKFLWTHPRSAKDLTVVYGTPASRARTLSPTRSAESLTVDIASEIGDIAPDNYEVSYFAQVRLRKIVVPTLVLGGHTLAMSEQIERRRAAFKAWLKAAGGVKAVSEKAKVPATTLYSYLSSKSQSLKGTTQDAIAEAFNVPVDELFGGAATVPVVGYVQAGAQAVLYEAGQGPFDYVPAPEGSTDKTVAVEIRGQSLGEFFEEWLVFYDDVRSPVTPDLNNKLCVVGLPDGRILVKKLKQSRSQGLYHLMSQTEGTMTDQEVAWAAQVKSMTPR